MAIGAAVGAITFSGSVIAFLKLQGIMSGAPITFKGQHFLNASLLILIVILTIYLCSTQSSNLFWILIAVSFLIGFLIIIPIGGADMPVVISMLNFLLWLGCCRYRFYFGKYRTNYYRSTGWIIWSNIIIHNVQRDE